MKVNSTLNALTNEIDRLEAEARGISLEEYRRLVEAGLEVSPLQTSNEIAASNENKK